MWGIIGTWEMVYDGIRKGEDILERNGHIFDAIESCIKEVENCKEYTSVGYGGLPNALGKVELDAAFMDGNTLAIGAIASIKDFANPISIARKLMFEKFNNFLVGEGAEKYSENEGFEKKDMLTEESYKKWVDMKNKIEKDNLSPYIGHDTVCVVGLDNEGNMATGTSTSGLFFKKAGRIGDTAIPGSGFYVDSEIGGACATGLGEDIMKGCVSFKIVEFMKLGFSPQEACNKAVLSLHNKLIQKKGKSGDISVIAMNNKGEFGAATNIEKFPFVASTKKESTKLYIASFNSGNFFITEYR
jgi:N4-(beta-N-acetylglucosaminyl)-L-asparaginase